MEWIKKLNDVLALNPYTNRNRVTVKYSEEFMIAFNPLFIKELCAGIDTEYMRMGFYNAKSPVMVYDGDFTYLVLPVNINGGRVGERINELMEAA